MNKSLHRQSGSAHIVIIIILVVAILGALGFVFWQNFLQPKATPQVITSETSAQTQEKPSPAATDYESYSNAEYSFSYPKDGWTVKEAEDTGTDSGIITPTVYSGDYAQQGMTLDAGALVGVYASVTTNTFDEEFTSIKESETTFGLKDIKKTTINGETAITYNSGYEGPRYHTVFIKNGKVYDIVYQYASTKSASVHMDTYELITSSFKFVE